MTDRTTGAFDDVDFTGFWEDYSDPVEPAPDDGLVAGVEEEIGFRLPDAYVEFARIRNGGIVRRCCHPTAEPTSWAEDHVQITTMYALGRTGEYSLLGDLGHALMRDEWEYPEWGVGIADTPSAGHEQIMLDYRKCGPRCENGEPTVVHVDQELDYTVTFVAPDFATFIKGLVDEEEFEEEPEPSEHGLADLERVRSGAFSPELRRGVDAVLGTFPDIESVLRRDAEIIVWQNDGFTPRFDGTSIQFYDSIYWLYSHLSVARSFEDYLAGGEVSFRAMLPESPADDAGFGPRSVDRESLRTWWDNRVRNNLIAATGDGFEPTDAFEPWVLSWIRPRKN